METKRRSRFPATKLRPTAPAAIRTAIASIMDYVWTATGVCSPRGAEPSWTWTDLVPNYNTTAFCCHFYENVSDTDDNLCVSNLPDDNTTRPVFIPANGHIITDRTTGATTMYNSTNPDNSTSTASSSNNGHASLGPDDHTGTEVAIGIGVGVPLALALCAALVVAGLERRKRVRERARWAEKGSTASAWMAGGPAYTPIREQQTVRPEGLAQGETVHELDGQAARHELSPVAGSEVTGSGMGSTGFANRYRSS
ncbi:MAG: hypothetical protein M1821_001610 [Bathelium mastoideum]|nr:MAG: hypothetical protein M1821_001610 [Bathelium mastoideum]